MHTSWSRFCTIIYLSIFQLEVTGPRMKLVTSEVEGEHSNHYPTDPPENNRGLGGAVVKKSISIEHTKYLNS